MHEFVGVGDEQEEEEEEEQGQEEEEGRGREGGREKAEEEKENEWSLLMAAKNLAWLAQQRHTTTTALSTCTQSKQQPGAILLLADNDDENTFTTTTTTKSPNSTAARPQMRRPRPRRAIAAPRGWPSSLPGRAGRAELTHTGQAPPPTRRLHLRPKRLSLVSQPLLQEPLARKLQLFVALIVISRLRDLMAAMLPLLLPRVSESRRVASLTQWSGVAQAAEKHRPRFGQPVYLRDREVGVSSN